VGYQHLEVARDGHVATLWLNRPDERNAMSADMWEDIPKAMAELDADESVRVVILAGRGPAFSVGIDIGLLGSMQTAAESQAAANLKLFRRITQAGDRCRTRVLPGRGDGPDHGV
jgi:enoyl-CoA hydratase/carnithine racemase